MLDIPIELDVEGLLANLRREGTPRRVYSIELAMDKEVENAIAQRYGLWDGLDPADPFVEPKKRIALHRFLGYELVPCGALGVAFTENRVDAQDTADLARTEGRRWYNEGQGLITSWADFERYPWPDPQKADLSEIEWLERNLPDDMALRAGCHTIFQYAMMLMSYQGLCYALYDQPDLVDAVFQRLGEFFVQKCQIYMQFRRIKVLFAADDMGFKSGLLVPARVLIEKSLPYHKRMAAMAHERGKLYLLHSCGKLDEIMPYWIDEAYIDGRHSFEDGIEPVTVAKRRWGDRIALLGGIDMDFLCRASEADVRRRVRETLDACLPGGGYCLGCGNTVANYVPVDNYLAMLDEGRRYSS